MNAMQQLLTEHMAVWTAADTEKKSGRGRASGNAGSVYGIKKLRELILELAVRGKLVLQDANDEPASELLKRIQTEKAKLAAEGKIKKDKPLVPVIDDEKPFDLPQGWEWVRVANLAEIKGGKRLPEGKSFSPVTTPHIYIQVTNMKNGSIIEENLKYIDEATRELIKSYTISSQDLYITIAGTIGDVGTVPPNFDGMILTENAAKIIFRELDKIWFKYCFKSSFLREQFQEKTIQLAQPKLALHRVASSVIALPPITEQHRIVAKVDELMTLCDQLEAQHSNAAESHEKLVSHLLGTLTQSQSADDFSTNWQRISAHFDTLFTTEASIDALKQTLLQLAVMGKLVPQDANDEPASELLKRIQAEKAKLVAEGKIKKEKPLAPIADDEKPFELPHGWEWVRLELLANLITKGSSPKWQGVNYSDNPYDVLFVTSENVGSYSLLLDSPKFVEAKFNEIEPRSILQRGDYLMNIVGASIGRTATFDRDDIANINQAVCLIRIENQNLSKPYLLHFFNSQTCLEYMFDKQVDNARPNLSMGNIAKFLIPIAPQAEQHRIVVKVDVLMTLCDQLKTRITAAKQHQQKLADVLVEQAVV